MRHNIRLQSKASRKRTKINKCTKGIHYTVYTLNTSSKQIKHMQANLLVIHIHMKKKLRFFVDMAVVIVVHC